MKLILLLCLAIVFHVNGGTVTTANMTLTQGKGALTVRPTAVTIKP